MGKVHHRHLFGFLSPLFRPLYAACRSGIAGLSILLVFNSALAVEPSTPEACRLLLESTFGPSDEELDLLIENSGDFFVLPKRAPDEVKKLNESTLLKMREEQVSSLAGSRKKTGLSMEELKKLYNDVLKNPQVTKSLCGKYNDSPQLGFCWGRAMAVHLKALQADVINRSVRKLWAVGELRSGSTEWRYHVTTLVRSNDGGWYAIDPIFENPMPAEEWYATMRSEFDPKRTMRIFSTPAKRFDPDTWAQYDKKTLADAYYYNFFSDLMNGIYTENTGKAGPWKEIAETGEAAFQARIRARNRAKKMKKALLRAGFTGAAAAYGYTLYYLNTREPENK